MIWFINISSSKEKSLSNSEGNHETTHCKMSFPHFKFFWHLQACKVFFIIHCTTLGSYQDDNLDKMYWVKLTEDEHFERGVWFCSSMGKADAQVAGLREPFDLAYLSCIIDSCNLVSGMIERQLRHSMRCLCTEKQHMLDPSWKENSEAEESALPSASAAQHSGQTQKDSPRSPHHCSCPLVRLWVGPLAHTRERKRIVLRNTQKQGNRQVSLQKAGTVHRDGTAGDHYFPRNTSWIPWIPK